MVCGQINRLSHKAAQLYSNPIITFRERVQAAHSIQDMLEKCTQPVICEENKITEIYSIDALDAIDEETTHTLKTETLTAQ